MLELFSRLSAEDKSVLSRLIAFADHGKRKGRPIRTNPIYS